MVSGAVGLSKGSHDAGGGLEEEGGGGGGGERDGEGTKAAPDAGPWEMDHRCLTQGRSS